MDAKPAFAEPHPARTFAAAVLAAVIGLGIFWCVATLFQSHGKPLERVAAAERACTSHAYQSEQRDCMKRWFAETQMKTLAYR